MSFYQFDIMKNWKTDAERREGHKSPWTVNYFQTKGTVNLVGSVQFCPNNQHTKFKNVKKIFLMWVPSFESKLFSVHMYMVDIDPILSL